MDKGGLNAILQPVMVSVEDAAPSVEVLQVDGKSLEQLDTR